VLIPAYPTDWLVRSVGSLFRGHEERQDRA
jgi:hypothetical protein